MLHDFRSVSQSHCDVTQGTNGVIGDEVSIPAKKVFFFFISIKNLQMYCDVVYSYKSFLLVIFL